MTLQLYFSDYFDVSEDAVVNYGAFNVSLVSDLPLFIDPFLLFNSDKEEYRQLHDEIIRYLRFLRRKSEAGEISEGLIKAWYCFSEIRQNWLGFCGSGNRGRGLGADFARALDTNLVHVFRNFGTEQVTRGSHLEKLCLIRSGVGRDMVSDFTTNLIKDYLLTYTQSFATAHLSPALVGSRSVERSHFSYELERWMPRTYTLPIYEGDFVILTPMDILTKDDTWINHSDMVRQFESIPYAVDNSQLRAEINNYFQLMIPRDREPTKHDYNTAVAHTLQKYPLLIDYYIKIKEDTGDEAVVTSKRKVSDSDLMYVRSFGSLARLLQQETPFYDIRGDTKEETRAKIEFFREVIENKGGHKLFYDTDGRPIRRETDIHIMFRLVWHGTPSDVSREVNDGRGPADFKISRGARDKTLVEFKLASNSHLRRNLARQLEVYAKASDAQAGYKVIVYFTEEELQRVLAILRELGIERDEHVVLVDARMDNKPSASKA